MGCALGAAESLVQSSFVGSLSASYSSELAGAGKPLRAGQGHPVGWLAAADPGRLQQCQSKLGAHRREAGEAHALGSFQGLGSRVDQTLVYCFVSIEIVVASGSTLIPMSVLISSKKYTLACSQRSPEGLADAPWTRLHPLGVGRHHWRPIWLFGYVGELPCSRPGLHCALAPFTLGRDLHLGVTGSLLILKAWLVVHASSWCRALWCKERGHPLPGGRFLKHVPLPPECLKDDKLESSGCAKEEGAGWGDFGEGAASLTAFPGPRSQPTTEGGREGVSVYEEGDPSGLLIPPFPPLSPLLFSSQARRYWGQEQAQREARALGQVREPSRVGLLRAAPLRDVSEPRQVGGITATGLDTALSGRARGVCLWASCLSPFLTFSSNAYFSLPSRSRPHSPASGCPEAASLFSWSLCPRTWPWNLGSLFGTEPCSSWMPREGLSEQVPGAPRPGDRCQVRAEHVAWAALRRSPGRAEVSPR